jgi:hypothetical protein
MGKFERFCFCVFVLSASIFMIAFAALAISKMFF